MANTFRRYLTRWVEISGTYAAEIGNSNYLAANPYFNPQQGFRKPLVLNELTAQALRKSRPLLDGELLSEAVLEYEQTKSALKRFVYKKLSERIKQAIMRVKHKKDPFEALGDLSEEVNLLLRIKHYGNSSSEEDEEVL